ncbi:hypothetical protein [Pseudomonas sp. MWU12-2323]|uniref:hypothetical protein n=1 Tax=Pseudomonas sp. MWU12-2323 TaxID=2651296 RepID=UPI00128E0C62|nr:hypothetical protein [Pseudomonas sp. MWU12-2323]MPQ69495.1 hypothetical protein [Pseudomonas sp. MWU12-2323]
MLNAQTTKQAINPPSLLVGTWDHLFDGDKGERTTRIVLDASTYKLIHMEVQANRAIIDSYRKATLPEIKDVEDSLVNANAELFDSPEEFGLQATSELPAWASCQWAPGQVLFYKPDPYIHGPIKVMALADKVEGYSTQREISLPFEPTDLYTPAALAQELEYLVFTDDDVMFKREKILARIGALQRTAELVGA